MKDLAKYIAWGIAAIVVWMLFYGATFDGKHYKVSFTKDHGVRFDTSDEKTTEPEPEEEEEPTGRFGEYR